jgi:hypothetical protein
MPTSFANSFSGPQGLLIAAALIVFFIVRQFGTRRVLSLWNVLAPAALLYFGLQGLAELDSTGWLLLGFSLSLAMALGVARGLTFRVWTDTSGQAWMRGGVPTLLLWIATIAVKAALTLAEIKFGLGSASTSAAASLIPGAVTIAAQLLVVYLRAQDARVASYQLS